MTSRSEKEIFDDLSSISILPGFAYVIAYFCLRDACVYTDELTPDLFQEDSMEKLIRTEISTLIGLMCKSDLTMDSPTDKNFNYMIKQTEILLEEMHKCLISPIYSNVNGSIAIAEKTSIGSFLREAIFYGPESVYGFQYLEFFSEKYKKDDQWLIKNKGFSIDNALLITECILAIQSEKISSIIAKNINNEDYNTYLFAFVVSIKEIQNRIDIDEVIIRNFVKSFSFRKNNKNSSFYSLSDYNEAISTPFIPVDDNNFLLFQSYSLLEALYEAPFYWMIDDKTYSDTLSKNRGAYTEDISDFFLSRVFGDQVYKNVKIKDTKNIDLGEIDVLVLYGDRLIILQAKSKRLTIGARKGNDSILSADFETSISKAYDQAYECGELILASNFYLYDAYNTLINLPEKPNEIYIITVICDHYPALNAQARQFLSVKSHNHIFPPLAMDIFCLDILTEFLNNPLYFLSYLNRRALFHDSFIFSNEIIILGYHLKNNLWKNDGVTPYLIDQSFASNIDSCILVRRLGYSGNLTPEGILTKFIDTRISKLIQNLSSYPKSGTISLGMLLLTLSEEYIVDINRALEEIIFISNESGNGDCSLAMDNFKTGITIHCNNDIEDNAITRLQQHCLLKKYKLKADSWYGICIDPRNGNIKFCLGFKQPWEKSEVMEDILKKL